MAEIMAYDNQKWKLAWLWKLGIWYILRLLLKYFINVFEQ